MFAVARSVHWSLVHNILLVVAALWPQCVCVCVCVLVPWNQFHNFLRLYPVALKRMWNWGHRSGAKRRKFFVVPLHFFGSKSIIIRQHSFVVFLYAVFLLTVPPCLDICKSGGTCPVPYEVGATACIICCSCHTSANRIHRPNDAQQLLLAQVSRWKKSQSCVTMHCVDQQHWPSQMHECQ